jgi:hypothetical protein
MNPKTSIKILKRGQRDAAPVAAETRGAQSSRGTRQATREVAEHVSAWVKEFRQRRPVDPRRAFAGLFTEPALNPVK